MHLILLLIIVTVSPAYAEAPLADEVRDVLLENVETEEAIKIRLLAEKKERLRLQRVKKRVSKVKSLEKKIAKVDGKILEISSGIKLIKAEIAKLDKQEEKARGRLRDKLETFNETAVTIARLERMPVEAMAAASSLRAAHNRKGIIEVGRKSLSGQISKNREDIYELQDIRTQRDEKVKAAQSLRHKRLAEKERLEKFFAQQMKLLAADDEERALLLQKAHKMKEQKTLSSLLKSYKKTTVYLPKARSALQGLPVKGKVVRGYNDKNENGVRAHGITIETTSNAPVTAVKEGRVIYSDSFREYGYIIILEHADGSNALYSGMGRSDKKVGDFLYAGKKIGLMSRDKKPELYLEIRKSGKTINPVKYLAKK